MLGLRYIEEVRREGYKPAHVVLSGDFRDEILPSWLQIQPDDTPETIDLRALRGCFVTVFRESPREGARWVAALRRAEAKTILSCINNDWKAHRLEGIDQ